MPKNQFQDIVPPQKRSIRDIPLPSNRRVNNLPPPPVTPPPVFARPRKEPRPQEPLRRSPPNEQPPQEEQFITTSPERDPYWRAGLWLLVLIALIFLFFGISFIFAGANVTVTPNSQNVSVNQTINADPNGVGGTIPYAVITLQKEGSTPVTSNGQQSVSDKASGEIIIYNNYSAASQSLVATTRFQTPEGLIFRIAKDVTVPGEITTNGQTTPGSVEMTVYADQPGEEYNVGLKDFTIPGFQGTPKAQGFYARSKTALVGGFVGTTTAVSATDLAAAKTKIEADLKSQFLTQANSQKPDNFILFPTAITTVFTPEINASGTGQTVMVRESGSAYAILFNRDILSKYLENNLAGNYSSSTLSGIDNLTFSFSNSNGFNPTISSSSDFSFKLEGNLKLVSSVDTEKLKLDLAGISRSALAGVLANYPSVEKAEVVFKPFWRWSFPKNTANIKVQIINP